MESHFRELQNFQVEYSPSVLIEYESDKTGMRVEVVQQEGPKVSGYFALATEIHDDSGAPHTLEHLCFMGSRNYQYKGFLDRLASRAYSSTNAWTATDHTAYTLETAGWDGFAQLLPVYLEHVLLPTLTDEACYTEVHHINGEGHDAGVVYSEMQALQNSAQELMSLRARRLVYPEAVGFRYETGGMLEHLRILTAERIRNFHHSMYQPRNLCLVVLGDVDRADLLQKLSDFENAVLDLLPDPKSSFVRPWTDPKAAQPLAKSHLETVEFPEEDESHGEISISFLGPNCNDALNSTALSILLSYLAYSSASVLENVLVEKEQRASGVYYSTESRPKIVVNFSLSGVAADDLATVEARFFELLKETADKDLNMPYIKECIEREKRQCKFQAEQSVTTFAEPIIQDFLFGERDGSTLRQLRTLAEYDLVAKWTNVEWQNKLREWFSDAHHVSILGKPSKALSKQLKVSEKTRIKKQKDRLGQAGLEKLARDLEKAKHQNERDIPDESLAKFPVPDTKSIHFLDTITAKSGAARQGTESQNEIQKLIDQSPSPSPLFLHFEHIKSNFVHISVVLGVEAIPVELRPMLTIYRENFFTTPIIRDGQEISFEQVVMELDKDTVSYSFDSAGSLTNPEMLCLRFIVEPSSYVKAIHWIKSLFSDAIFDITRLKSIVARMLADIPEEKRDGSSMSFAVESTINNAPSSLGRSSGILVTSIYLKRVRWLLEHSPDTIISNLDKIKKGICQFSNLRVLVAANVETLPNPVGAWNDLTKDLDTTQPLIPLDRRLSRLTDTGKNPGNTSYIIPIPPVDSSYSISVAKGPDSPRDPCIPALMVALAYLDTTEGPMWTAVRGTGLAYGVGFSRQTYAGQVSFDIYRSPDAFKAFKASKEVVEGFATRKSEFEDLALEGATSNIILKIANSESTMSNAADASFSRQVMSDLPKDWVSQQLERIRKVTKDELHRTMEEIVMPLFRPESSNLIVTCAPIMEAGLVEGFESLGFKPQVKLLSHFEDDYGLKAGEDAEDEDDDEEDEDYEDDGESDDDEDDSEGASDDDENGDEAAHDEL